MCEKEAGIGIDLALRRRTQAQSKPNTPPVPPNLRTLRPNPIAIYVSLLTTKPKG